MHCGPHVRFLPPFFYGWLRTVRFQRPLITLSTLLMTAHKAETAVQGWSVDAMEDVILTHTHTCAPLFFNEIFQLGFIRVSDKSQTNSSILRENSSTFSKKKKLKNKQSSFECIPYASSRYHHNCIKHDRQLLSSTNRQPRTQHDAYNAAGVLFHSLGHNTRYSGCGLESMNTMLDLWGMLVRVLNRSSHR